MKDEIKEILDNPKILMLSYGNYISLNDYVKLKDYITNLRTIEQEYSAILSENAELENKITNLQERKITKEDVNKYFEENMMVSFDKFIENWNEQEQLANYYKKENEKLKEKLEDETLNKEIAQGHRKQVQDIELQERKELKDYKSRCEKARKMIKFIAYNNERPLTITELNKVYNILGGDDNE